MKEYGGYFPLELHYGKEYYTQENGDVRTYNSGRSSIYKAFEDCRAKRIWIPVYLCDSVEKLLSEFNVEISYYNIDRNFAPVNIDEKNGDVVLYPNYFGLQEDKIYLLKNCYSNLILDNTQAFYTPPVSGAYNVYSCRKFLGVCDGSYLISDKFVNVDKESLEISRTHETSNYLLKAIDLSTNDAYGDYLENEDRITREGVRRMSKLTTFMLRTFNYENDKKIRLENYHILNSRLKAINELQFLNPKFAPMIYPLLIRNDGLRQHLVSNKVYVPQWWKAVITNSLSNDWERYISKYLIPLPIDQRYTVNDMEYLADIVEKYIDKKFL